MVRGCVRTRSSAGRIELMCSLGYGVMGGRISSSKSRPGLCRRVGRLHWLPAAPGRRWSMDEGNEAQTHQRCSTTTHASEGERRGRWREALKDGLVESVRSKALALND